MLRITTCLCLLLINVLGQDSLDDMLDEVFNQGISNSVNLTKGCDNIVGHGSGCYECYTCERERKSHRRRAEIFNLYDNQCGKVEVCCFPQSESILRENEEVCGKNNPEGHPRRVRDSLRAVLPGEYPWRAWIYNKSKTDRPLCAATLVSKTYRVLMTLAHCVQNNPANSLFVSFTKDSEATHDVVKISTHKNYNSNTRDYDIALLHLSHDENLPTWAHPVCWSSRPVAFGTACITVSSDDNYANAVIPQQSRCSESNRPFDEFFMCSVAPKNDHQPEKGSALICPEIELNDVKYTVYGISSGEGSSTVSVHTNVTFFSQWIVNTMSEIIR